MTGKRAEKNEGKSLKTGGNGGKWRNMEECQEKSRKKTTEKEGKWRNDTKKVEKKRRKIVENRGKMEETGGMLGKR